MEWDPYSFTILTEEGGTAVFKDVIEGQTVHEQVDENTGMSALVIMESSDEKKQPRIEIKDDKGKMLRKYLLPSGAHVMVDDQAAVSPGDMLAKIPRETAKTKDITGGLPRVVELFEARRPKEPAVITEIDGVVKYGDMAKQHRKIFVTADDAEQREYQLPRGAHINVQEGERVKAGEPLMDGPIDPHDILRVRGEKELQRYLVDEIQEVYRLQGVNINDKHIEVISRQMMRWVKVEDVGDTEFLIDEVVDKFRFISENEKQTSKGKKAATGRPLLLGITKASLSTDSFISAASFQETTRVLTEAAISGKVDYLRGLKENVIMGRLIPAGTGMEYYRRIKIPEEVIERPESALEGDYEPEYMVEPEHIKESRLTGPPSLTIGPAVHVTRARPSKPRRKPGLSFFRYPAIACCSLREHLDDADAQVLRVLRGFGRGDLPRDQDIDQGQRLHRAATRDRVEATLVAAAATASAFRDVQDDRQGSALELIAQDRMALRAAGPSPRPGTPRRRGRRPACARQERRHRRWGRARERRCRSAS